MSRQRQALPPAEATPSSTSSSEEAQSTDTQLDTATTPLPATSTPLTSQQAAQDSQPEQKEKKSATAQFQVEASTRGPGHMQQAGSRWSQHDSGPQQTPPAQSAPSSADRAGNAGSEKHCQPGMLLGMWCLLRQGCKVRRLQQCPGCCEGL